MSTFSDTKISALPEHVRNLLNGTADLSLAVEGFAKLRDVALQNAAVVNQVLDPRTRALIEQEAKIYQDLANLTAQAQTVQCNEELTVAERMIAMYNLAQEEIEAFRQLYDNKKELNEMLTRVVERYKK